MNVVALQETSASPDACCFLWMSDITVESQRGFQGPVLPHDTAGISVHHVLVASWGEMA